MEGEAKQEGGEESERGGARERGNWGRGKKGKREVMTSEKEERGVRAREIERRLVGTQNWLPSLPGVCGLVAT